MDCPVCPQTPLVMSERQGIEIDYCPKCRGVWLDRGELDKLIERSQQQLAMPPAPPPRYGGEGGEGGEGGYYKGYRKKSLWHEIFD